MLPAGFTLVRLTHAPTLSALIDALTWEQPTIRVYGRTVAVPRLTCWMGERAYTYSKRRNEPSPMPAVVAELRGVVETQTGAEYNSVLANHYRDGADSVAWHADDEPELGAAPTIASVSLGASRGFAIRHKATGERTLITLHHGDLLIMRGRSQADYLHSVPKTTRAVGARINLTFRQVGP